MVKMHQPKIGKIALRKIALRTPAVESIWIAAARELGWHVERTSAAYASSDGQRRIILIGVDDVLDADDSVAQLVFHELCHGLVQGPEHWSSLDWGLSNEDDRDVVAEHACLWLQVFLTTPHDLRMEMSPTTEYRPYHDSIAEESLASATDPAATMARAAMTREQSASWLAVLERALAQTRARLTPEIASSEEQRHPTGFEWGSTDQSCETCGWFYRGGRGPAVERCRQSAEREEGEGLRTLGTHRACVRWEPPPACQSCGACCREAYHSVTVSMRDPVV